MGEFTLQPEINFGHQMVTYAHLKPNTSTLNTHTVYDICVVFQFGSGERK